MMTCNIGFYSIRITTDADGILHSDVVTVYPRFAFFGPGGCGDAYW